MKHSVLLYLSLAACLFTGCYEDEPQEEAREVQRITFRTDDNSWTSTRSVADGKEMKFHMASEDGSKYMSMTVSEEPMTGRAATRGAQASSASISTFGVSGSLCMRNSSYTAVGCGSFFYNEEVAPGISMDYAWPTSDYKLSFFAYYPYDNDNLTMASLATEKGIPAYTYTVPEDAADHVDVMTANVLDMLGGQQTPVNLSFQHRLAAIRFRLTNTGDNPMIVKSVTIAGVKYTGTLRNATWTLGSDTGEGDPRNGEEYFRGKNQRIMVGRAGLYLQHQCQRCRELSEVHRHRGRHVYAEVTTVCLRFEAVLFDG